MTMAKKLPLLAPSIHTFEVNGTYTDCEAKRTVFMAIQKMVSAGKYYRIPYHGSSKKGYSYKRKDGGLTITLADYPDFKKRYITLSGVNLARIAGDPSRLSLTDLSPGGLATQEQAFLDELEQLGLLEIEDVSKPYPSFGAKRIPLDSAAGIQRDLILLIFNAFVRQISRRILHSCTFTKSVFQHRWLQPSESLCPHILPHLPPSMFRCQNHTISHEGLVSSPQLPYNQ